MGGGVTGELHLLQSAHGLHHQVEPGENRLCGSVCKSKNIATVSSFNIYPSHLLKGPVHFDNDGSRVVNIVEIFQYRLIINESAVISRVYFSFTQNINDSHAEFFYKSGESNITVFKKKKKNNFFFFFLIFFLYFLFFFFFKKIKNFFKNLI